MRLAPRRRKVSRPVAACAPVVRVRMSERSDQELMQAAAGGDADAFGEIVTRHQRLVFQFLYRFHGGPDRDAVEDLVQDVFLRAWRAVKTYRPEAKVTTWLLQIALNLSLNYRRSMRLRRTRVLEDNRGAEAGPGDHELIESVRTAVAALPEGQRAALVLATYHELSYAEIAEILETTRGAIESLLFRARENLRKRLRNDERLPPPAPDSR